MSCKVFSRVLTAFVVVAVPALAQGRDYEYGGVYLPPVGGTTAMSANVTGQASYIRSMGDFVESVAAARRENAAAVEHEIRNSLEWVSSYFDRRELNRAYYLKANPHYLDNEQHRQEILKRRVTQLFEEALRGDQTDEMNWLLHQLAGMTLPYQYLPGDQPAASPDDVDVPLSTQAIHHVIFTDGGRQKGKLLTFPADTAQVLETPWPRALRDDRFAPLRKQFEDIRDDVLARRAKGERDWEVEKRLMAACDALGEEFNAAYPREVRVRSSADYVTYAAGKRFLQALASGVLRTITTEDPWAFDGSYRFEGETVIELVQHMCHHGLEFAPCRPGGEGVYRSLFLDLRKIYLRLGADDPYRELERQE